MKKADKTECMCEGFGIATAVISQDNNSFRPLKAQNITSN